MDVATHVCAIAVCDIIKVFLLPLDKGRMYGLTLETITLSLSKCSAAIAMYPE